MSLDKVHSDVSILQLHILIRVHFIFWIVFSQFLRISIKSPSSHLILLICGGLTHIRCEGVTVTLSRGLVFGLGFGKIATQNMMKPHQHGMTMFKWCISLVWIARYSFYNKLSHISDHNIIKTICSKILQGFLAVPF